MEDKLIVKDVEKLTQLCEEFNFQNPQVDPRNLSLELAEAVCKYDGIGLAANQIGYNLRVFVLPGAREHLVCFNPRVVMYSSEIVELEEGCLSWPGIICKIKRPQHVRVRFADLTGDIHTQQFTGMTARVFQHEMEHLDGKLFFSNLRKMELIMVLKKAEKSGHSYAKYHLTKYAK